jgi:catechol 2,3-dioxygenase-like lactoylglutathione lyase family enzyme
MRIAPNTNTGINSTSITTVTCTFEGTASDRGLEYSGLSKNEAGHDVLNRMDIVKEGANQVKVLWRKSQDSGKTWTTAYEAIYSRTDNTNREGMMLGTQKIVAFAAVRDRDAARKFYRDTLGLRLVGEDQFALVFDANGTTLRISPVPDWTPPRFTVLGWEVKDIVAVVKDLRSAGIEFERYAWMKDQDEMGIWTSPSDPGVAAVHAGARVAWFKDPDGNVLSVSQMPG